MLPIIMIGVLGGLSIAKAGMQMLGAEAQEEALALQEKQMELQYQEKTLSNLSTLQKVLDAQIAQATVRGYSLDSPSFNAIQRETFNIGGREQKNLEMSKSLMEENFEIEKQNVRNSLYAQLFGDALDFGAKAYGVNSLKTTTG